MKQILCVTFILIFYYFTWPIFVGRSFEYCVLANFGFIIT